VQDIPSRRKESISELSLFTKGHTRLAMRCCFGGQRWQRIQSSQTSPLRGQSFLQKVAERQLKETLEMWISSDEIDVTAEEDVPQGFSFVYAQKTKYNKYNNYKILHVNTFTNKH